MSKIRILIVEDEPIIAADLQSQLEKLGYEVIDTLESGEEALELLKGDEPDIILMDVQLEGDLDGIDTVHEIHKDHDIPIIFLTSNTDQRTFARAKLTKPHAFLSKPFRMNDIVFSIDLALFGEEEMAAQEHDSVEIVLKDRIFIRDKSYLHKVMFEDIQYIEADSAYSKVVTDQKTFVISQTLKRLQENLKSDFIKRIHRSFMINVLKVDRLSEGYVHVGAKAIPVGRSYKEDLGNVFRSL